MNPDVPVKTITISEDNASLRGIQRTINKADAGIRASVINDGNGYRLVLSSLVAGNDNSIRRITRAYQYLPMSRTMHRAWA